MSVTSETSKVKYNCNGSTVNFPITFAILETSHIKVIHFDFSTGLEAELSTPAEYSVVGSDVVTVATYPTNDTLTIIRDVPVTQEVDLIDNDPFPAETIEDSLDKLTMLIQQQGGSLDRAIVVPVSDVSPQLELPLAAARADQYLYFDSNGDVTTQQGAPPQNWVAWREYAIGDLVNHYYFDAIAGFFRAQLWESLVGSNQGNTPDSSPSEWAPYQHYGIYWQSAKKYGLNDLVYFVNATTNRKLYYSVQTNNTGNAPSTSPTWWREIKLTQWSTVVDYAVNDIVPYLGRLWKCVQANYGIAPGSNLNYWHEFVTDIQYVEREYYINELCFYDGNFYQSLQNNNNQNIPDQNPDYWKLYNPTVTTSDQAGNEGAFAPTDYIPKILTNGYTNEINDPNDLTASGWTTVSAIVTLTDQEIDGCRFTKIDDNNVGAGGRVEYNFTPASSGTELFSFTARKGDQGASVVDIYDTIVAGSIVVIEVDFDNRSVSIDSGTGLIVGSRWIDETTVTVWFNCSVVSGNLTKIRALATILSAPLLGYTFYTKVMRIITTNTFLFPFIEGTLAAVNPSKTLTLPEKTVIALKVKPHFNYDTATAKILMHWNDNINSFLEFEYTPSIDQFRMLWKDGGTGRDARSLTFDNGSSFVNLNQVILFVMVFDPTSNNNSGLYCMTKDGNFSVNTVTNTMDLKTTDITDLEIGHLGGANEGESEIEFLRIYNGTIPMDLTTKEEVLDAIEGLDMYFQQYKPIEYQPLELDGKSRHAIGELATRVDELEFRRADGKNYQRFNIASTSYVVKLSNQYPLFTDLTLRWFSGDGSDTLTFASGPTIQGVAASNWTGEGRGHITLIRTAEDTWYAKGYFDVLVTASGEVIEKFLSGEMVISHVDGTTRTTSSTSGSIFVTSLVTLTFPKTFVAAPQVADAPEFISTAALWQLKGGTITTTQVGLRLGCSVNTGQGRVGYIAKGKWITL
jgi:hypothetical protein